jgi:carboxymethylenebutenolidase
MKKIFTTLWATLFGIACFAQDFALKQLEESPRHQEWVKVANGDKQIACFVVFPEVSEKALAVIVIHENRGLNDWARSMADQIAALGYIAIAPDLLSGKAPNGGNTPDFPNGDDARKAIYELNPDEITSDLNAVAAYVRQLPAANGKFAVGGFCWGGSQSFRYATNQPELSAAIVFYGGGPQEEGELSRISSPVYGFYGGNDERVNATIPGSEAILKKLSKPFSAKIYQGAGHGFMRAGQDPKGRTEDIKARDAAYEELARILKSL